MKELEIFILGCGKTGRELISRLDHHWRVTVLDTNVERFERLGIHPNVETVEGDGTSEMILRRAGAERARYAVACTTDDEANIAFCSLMRHRFNTPVIVSLAAGADAVEWLGKIGATAINRAAASAALIRNRIETGIVETTEIGLAQGEILEVQLHERSYYAGLTVGDLPTRDFRIAAIYRDNSLILPKRETVLLPRDRIVLVGEAHRVRGVAEAFLSGELQFPAQYGNRVLLPIFGFQPPTETTIAEAIYITRTSRASGLDAVIFPEGLGSLDTDAIMERLQKYCAEADISLHMATAEDRNLPSLTHLTAEGKVGIVILPAEKIGLFRKFSGTSFTRSAINAVDVPVLISRGSFPYSEIVVPCLDIDKTRRALEIAVDVTRLDGAHVVALQLFNRILPTRTRRGEGPSTLELFLVELAKLHRKEVAVEKIEGNPVTVVARRAASENTLVMMETVGIEPRNIFNPDVDFHVVHTCNSSVMVLPREMHHAV